MKKHRKTPAFKDGLPLPCRAAVHGATQTGMPQNLDDIRQLSKQAEAGPCDKCGVVTDISSKQRELRHRQNTPLPGSPVVATTPVIGSGDVVRKEAREPFSRSTSYVVTVRYDNGAYAFFEQDDQPTVAGTTVSS